MSMIARLSLDQYDRMIEHGVFERRPRQRLEPIRGAIREMTPIGPQHEDVVDRLTNWSAGVLPEASIRLRVQNSVGLPGLESAPEPDIAWLVQRDYSQQRPSPGDVLLIVEVTASSLAYDTGEKADLYAAASIGDSPQAPEAAKVEDPAPIRPESTSRAVPPAGPHACSAAGPIRPGHRQHRRASSPSRDEAPCSRFRET